MAIIKEFLCPGHGPFESDKPICPRGCTVAEREFRTAPAYHDGTHTKVDRLVRGEMDKMGITNIRSSREGETARIESPAMRQQAEFQKQVRAKYSKPWQALPKGENAVATVLAQHKAPATDATAAIRGSKPTYEAVQDKQGLKLDISKAA